MNCLSPGTHSWCFRCIRLRHRTSAVRLEEQIGTVVAVMTPTGKKSGHARFGLPKLPERIADVTNVDEVAQCMGLLSHQIGFGNFTPAVYSAGVPFTLVPVKDPSVLREIKFQRRGWADIFGTEATGVFAYCPTPNDDESDFAARTFVDLNGFKEDPATGSAVSAMIGAFDGSWSV